MCIFFFSSRRRHTRLQGDWSSDVCSSDLFVIGVALSEKGRLVDFRVAEDASRLKCFYGKRFSNETWGWLRNELLADLKANKGNGIAKYESPSPQISFGIGHYARDRKSVV